MNKISSQKDPTHVGEVIDKVSGKILLSPCQIACPLGEDIQRNHAMLALLPLDAEEVTSQIIKIGDEIYEKNPLFPVCSYICGLCEKECNYKDQTGAVRRRMLVRLIADYYLPYLKTKPPLPTPTKEKVAVIGGGAGSLVCAYMLSKKGYRVSILDKGSELGGALRYIPRYRLPQDILDTTLNNLVRIAHAEVKFGVEIGDSGKTLADLKNEGYQAVFIATGAHLPRPLTTEGEGAVGTDLEEVMFGLNLLWDTNQGTVSPQRFQGKKVIVVGGGNAAVDAARVAKRLGAKEISIVYRRSRAEMPAVATEVDEAEREGVEINFLAVPVSVLSKDDKLTGIQCIRMELGEPDASGRRRSIPIKGSEFNMEVDNVIIAIGQTVDKAMLPKELEYTGRGTLSVDPVTLQTNIEGVFAGGDVRQVGFAAEAMRDGMMAAESIDRYLKGEDLKAGRKKEYESTATPKRTDYKPQPELIWAPVEDGLNFEPFEKGFTLEEAVQEAKRCLYCGPCESCKGCVALDLQPEIPEIEFNKDLCITCGNCVFYCPYDAAKMENSGGITFDSALCKGCGLCVAMCPALALDLEYWEKERISILISKLSSEMKQPKILVFHCQWAVFPPQDEGTNQNIRFIDLPCAARVDTSHILEAFQKGVDGVLIAACLEEDCHRGSGSREAQHLTAKLMERLSQLGLQDRLHFCTVAPRYPEEFDKELEQFSQKIKAIGSKESKGK